MRRGLVVSLALFVSACGGAEPPPPSSTSTPPPTSSPPPTSAASGATPRMEGGYLVAEGSPPPLACTTDADCTFNGALGDNCCWTFRDMNAVVMSSAYRQWQDAYRTAHCGQAECPSPPVPSAPPDCLFRVHCVEGSCDNECTW